MISLQIKYFMIFDFIVNRIFHWVNFCGLLKIHWGMLKIHWGMVKIHWGLPKIHWGMAKNSLRIAGNSLRNGKKFLTVWDFLMDWDWLLLSVKEEEKLTDTSCQKIYPILEWEPISWIHDVDSAVGTPEKLRISRQYTASKENCCSMWAWGCCPGSNRAAVGLRGATTNGLQPGRCILPVPHPVVVDNGLGGGHIHKQHFVLLWCSVLRGNFWGQQNIHWFPWPKPHWVPVCGGVLLPENVAGNVLRHLK